MRWALIWQLSITTRGSSRSKLKLRFSKHAGKCTHSHEEKDAFIWKKNLGFETEVCLINSCLSPFVYDAKCAPSLLQLVQLFSFGNSNSIQQKESDLLQCPHAFRLQMGKFLAVCDAMIVCSQTMFASPAHASSIRCSQLLADEPLAPAALTVR